jgi:hypothetical protein
MSEKEKSDANNKIIKIGKKQKRTKIHNSIPNKQQENRNIEEKQMKVKEESGILDRYTTHIIKAFIINKINSILSSDNISDKMLLYLILSGTDGLNKENIQNNEKDEKEHFMNSKFVVKCSLSKNNEN